ncbi:MAG: ribonuclease III [Methylococcales bacterium]|nr:ribonuclease III [Methylococcales bacterium]
MIKAPHYLAEKLGLVFDDPELFRLALTHRSMGGCNNERLEFLGDSILGFVIAEALYQRFPQASEGVLSRLRASLVNQDSLATIARKYEMGDYLILGSGELKSGGFRRNSILSDTVEAIIGALFKDQGILQCERWLLKIFAFKLDILNIESEQKDPKTRLQELMQAQKIQLPVYELLSMSGLPHTQKFKINCHTMLTNQECIGEGVSRKKAEQAAAAKMLTLLESETS